MPVSPRRLVLVLCAMRLVGAAPLGAADLTAIERTIGKQPAYGAAPRYCLLACGAEAKVKVWIVEDGRTLYVDRNANGDLTDDGPPLRPTEVRDLGALDGGPPRWDFDYVLGEFRPAAGLAVTDFRLRRWNYGEERDGYGLSLTLRDDRPGAAAPGRPAGGEGIPMFAGWFGRFWADSPAQASVIHFGGPLEPRLLREREFVVDSEAHRLSVGLVTPGLGDAGPALLSEFAIPISTPISVRIEWPVAPDAPPLVTTHKLDEHCCYWEYYDEKFRVPPSRGIVEGVATVTVELPDGRFPLPLRTNKLAVPVRMTGPPGDPAK